VTAPPLAVSYSIRLRHNLPVVIDQAEMRKVAVFVQLRVDVMKITAKMPRISLPQMINFAVDA
jgi:hypothetical protein